MLVVYVSTAFRQSVFYRKKTLGGITVGCSIDCEWSVTKDSPRSNPRATPDNLGRVGISDVKLTS